MNKSETLGFLNLLILILSVYVLIALVVDTFVVLPLETARMLNYIDDAICIGFTGNINKFLKKLPPSKTVIDGFNHKLL